MLHVEHGGVYALAFMSNRSMVRDAMLDANGCVQAHMCSGGICIQLIMIEVNEHYAMPPYATQYICYGMVRYSPGNP